MEVLEIVLPVLAMIILGILCRKWKLLDQSGVNNMKTLVTNIMLPVAIFHALATAEYSGKIGILVLIMFVMLLIPGTSKYKQYFALLGTFGATAALAYPLFDPYPFPHVTILSFIIGHVALLGNALLYLFRNYQPSLLDLKNVVVITFALNGWPKLPTSGGLFKNP